MDELITTQTSEQADIAAGGDGLESRLDRIIGDSLNRGQTCALVLVADAAHPVFFILMVMTLVDVLAGFSVTIRAAGRDVNLY